MHYYSTEWVKQIVESAGTDDDILPNVGPEDTEVVDPVRPGTDDDILPNVGPEDTEVVDPVRPGE